MALEIVLSTETNHNSKYYNYVISLLRKVTRLQDVEYVETYGKRRKNSR